MAELYPFIDIAALDTIREGFARGDALVLLTMDFSHILWANNAGAQLLGHDNLQTTIGAATDFSVTTKRQLTALGATAASTPRIVNLRLAASLHAPLTQAELSQIILPDQNKAHLLRVKATTPLPAQQLIAGLTTDIHHAAILTASGEIIASSAQFNELEINKSTLADLAIEVKDAQAGLIKRRIRAGTTTIPAAILHLQNDENFSLLIAAAPIKESIGVNQTDEVQTDAVPQSDNETQNTQILSSTYFSPAKGDVHFVWKTNATGFLTELSSEFTQTLGFADHQFIGESFETIAQNLNLEGFDEISSLLDGRDTWAGRQIHWPTAKGDWIVPVEFAALPAFSRDREFAGFHGFGIIHCAQAQPIVAKTTEPVISEALEENTEQSDNKTSDLLDALKTRIIDEDIAAATQEEETARTLAAPSHAEMPKSKESRLSPAERNAFREIAERLRRQGIQQADEYREQSTDHYSPPVLIASNDDGIKLLEEEQTEAPFATDFATNGEETNSNIALLKDAVKKKQQASSAHQAGEFLAQLPVPLIIYSSNHIHYANDAFLELTAYSSINEIEELGGVEALFNAETDISDNNNSMVLIKRNGEPLAVDAHLQSVPWDDGRALMISIMARRDETEEPQEPQHIHYQEDAINDNMLVLSEAKLALQTEIAELKTILDTATDGVVLINEDGSIRSMNHSASALFGFQKDEMIAKSFKNLFADESQQIAMDYLTGLSSNGVMSVLNDGREIIGREAQGGNIPLFMTIGKLPSSNGYCAVLRDITQWKRAEEELKEARKKAELASSHKSDFLARISHEIRTPLNAIIGFSELMINESFGRIENQRYKDYMRDINRSGNHVLALVNDLLDISKIEAGGQDMDFDAVSVNEIIQECIALMQPQANRNRVIIRSSLMTDLPDIVADGRSLKQIILNLLTNAVKFTNSGGQVIVSTAHELSGAVVIRVRDNGIGMTQQEIDIALKPFRQVQNNMDMPAPHPSDAGTGLGLPLTKAMVEANRAQLSIESEPGHGTLVEVAFPSIRVLAN